MIKLDYWYPEEPKPRKIHADCFFSDLDCIYRGNIYNEGGKPIGDYIANDSTEIEKHFSGIFGE